MQKTGDAMLKKIFRIFLLFVALAFTAIAVDIWRHLWLPTSSSGEVSYQLLPGTSLKTVAAQLQTEGLLQRPEYFVAYARIRGLGARVQAGEYRFPPGITPLEILDRLLRGNVVLYRFTIVEGWNIFQLRAALRQEPALRHELDPALSNDELMRRLGFEPGHPEGQFYPDTYAFARGTTDIEFLQRAHRVLLQRLQAEWEQRSPGLPLKSPYEALILASIIEKETAVASERELISSVFINRLNKRMRLQTDPTVIYGIGEEYDGNIRWRHLRTDTPYNTYTRGGLPPTPIAMAGGASIRAALNPVESDMLFFVSRNDGSHKFSATLAEHEAAVDLYQRSKRKQTNK